MTTPENDPINEACAFVRTHLADALAPLPASIRHALESRLAAEYAAPRTSQLEQVLRKRLTDNEVRHLQFAPTPAQYHYYATLLSLRSSVAPRHPSGGDGGGEEEERMWPAIMQKRFLTVFYLKHARHWPLVVEFILQDGLQILVDLFLAQDLQVRGQAIDCFVQITSHVAFEWFDPPVGYQARVLHAKMRALATSECGLVRQLVANVALYERDGADGGVENETEQIQMACLPHGSSGMLLQVLAFFLSWVRKLYTRNELRLSRELLVLLRDWRERTRCTDDEEDALATRVYEDFNRWPAIEDSDGACGDMDEQERGREHIAFEKEATTAHDADEDLFSVPFVAQLLANDANDDAVDQVIQVCTAAISAGVGPIAEAYVWRARARARRLEKRTETQPTGVTVRLPAISVDAEELRHCVSDCEAARALEPTNMDAWRCQLRVLAATAQWGQAVQALDAIVGDMYTSTGETDTATAAGLFFPEDLAFLTTQRDHAANELQRQQQHEKQQQQLDQVRLRKQDAIARALLDRQNTEVKPAPGRFDTPKVKATAKPPASSTIPQAKTKPDILARFRSSKHGTSSSTVRKPIPLRKSTDPARAFSRKFMMLGTDARRLLLLDTPPVDVLEALRTVLPEAHLPIVLAILVDSGECGLGDDVRAEHTAKERGTSNASCCSLSRRVYLLRQLLAMPRFTLYRDVATADMQQEMNRNLVRAEVLLTTATGDEQDCSGDHSTENQTDRPPFNHRAVAA